MRMSPTKNPGEMDAGQRKKLQGRIAKAPNGPGIYRFLDEAGTVLYVGKAKNLRNRLKSYVNVGSQGGLGPWKLSLVTQIHDFDVTVVGSELEALVLETNLIKELRPKYNVLMKDDKNYVYIRVSVQEPYPRVEVVRQMANDGAKYFGPKMSAEQTRGTLSFLRKIFPYRTCKMEIEPAAPAIDNEKLKIQIDRSDSQLSIINSDDENIPGVPLNFPVICKHKDRPTPCLDFHIGHCSAPCIGRISPERYRSEIIDGVLQFLKGNHAEVEKLLEARMAKAAADKKFEVAARLRDQLASVRGVKERQTVSDTSGEDADFIGVALLSNRAHVVVLQERDGKVVGESAFSLNGQAEDASQVLDEFLPQYYADAADLPDSIVVGAEVADGEVIAQWLSGRKGKKVTLRVPERGKRIKLLDLADKNAAEKARQMEVKWEAEKRNTEGAIEELQRLLELPTRPERIEGYDISHLGGTETVASMVVMKGGKPANDLYRSFTIQSVKRGDIDDFKSIKEVLRRRLRYLSRGTEEERWAAQGVTFGRALKKDTDDTSDAFVARADDETVALCRIVTHDTGLRELRMEVQSEHLQPRIGQFLVSRALKSEKKGKIYAVIDPVLEPAYAEVGFRHVLKAPPVLQDREGLVLVYDVAKNKDDKSFSCVPDLLVIDGGKGQLHMAVDALKEAGLQIPVIGLAKREEEVFVPGKSDSIPFPKDSPAKFLLMRLRDESHRFANRHREKRGFAAAKRSALDDVPGIGPDTRKALISTFGTIDGVRAASDDQLRTVMNQYQLEALRDALGR